MRFGNWGLERLNLKNWLNNSGIENVEFCEGAKKEMEGKKIGIS